MSYTRSTYEEIKTRFHLQEEPESLKPDKILAWERARGAEDSFEPMLKDFGTNLTVELYSKAVLGDLPISESTRIAFGTSQALLDFSRKLRDDALATLQRRIEERSKGL